MERQLVLARERLQVGPVADDDDGLGAKSRGRFREQAFEDVRLLRHEDGEALRAGGREMDFRFHLQLGGGLADVVLDGGAVELLGRPRGLQRHAELAAGDLFLHGFDVGAELEEELRDARDDAGLVLPDESDGGEVLGHKAEL